MFFLFLNKKLCCTFSFYVVHVVLIRSISIHNLCFRAEIKHIETFWLKKNHPFKSYVELLYGPCQTKTCLWMYAKCADFHNLAHAQGPARAFALPWCIQWYPMIQSGSGQRSLWSDCVSAQSHHENIHIILTLLNPTFLNKNWGLQGYTLFFLFLLKTVDYGYSLEPPALSRNMKNIRIFIWKLSVFGDEIFNIFE